MDFKERKSVSDELKKYCYFAKEHDCVEVTEWANDEGVDITIDSNRKLMIGLTHGELKAINHLVTALEVGE